MTRDRAWKVLSKYEIKEPLDARGLPVSLSAKNDTDAARFRDLARYGSDSSSTFDWSPERPKAAFQRDLVSMATAYFESIRGPNRAHIPLHKFTKAPWHRNAMSVVLLALFYSCCYRMFVHESWLAMFAAPFAGWLLAANYWHDALHFSLSNHWYVNQFSPYLFPFFMSPFMWLHQHTIGHHVHTNDPLRDPDVNAAPQFIRLSKFQKMYPVHRFQKSRAWTVFLWSIATSTLKPLLRDHISRAEGWYGSCVPLVFSSPIRKMLHIMGRLTVLCLMSVWPYLKIAHWTLTPLGLYTIFKAHCFAWIPAMTFSVLFVGNAQINHLNEANEHSSSASDDFFVHQAQTSSSYATESYAAFVCSGGLNLQIEHHLLPGINHYHLYWMSPMIKEVCEKHGVVYTKMKNFGEALEMHLRYNESMADTEQQTSERMKDYMFAKDTRLTTKLKQRREKKAADQAAAAAKSKSKSKRE
jgi:fatty acid desaturase